MHGVIAEEWDQEAVMASNESRSGNIVELLELGVENGTFDLRTQKYCVMNSSQSYCGDLRMGVTFTPRVETETYEQEFRGCKENYWNKKSFLFRILMLMLDCPNYFLIPDDDDSWEEILWVTEYLKVSCYMKGTKERSCIWLNNKNV
nr:hypothetical protein [Tanacetum cinerariifolium]